MHSTKLKFLLLITCILVTCSEKVERDFTTRDLVIPTELIPDGLEISPAGIKPMGPTIGFGDANDSHLSLKTTTEKFNVANHFVLQYDNYDKAQKGYIHESLSQFNDNSIAVNGSWKRPDNWTFQSQLASMSRVACNINNIAGDNLVCKYMAQYEEFVVIFTSTISPEVMTIEQFEDVVEGIDEIMVTNLGG